jgi:hypothetical protein
MRDVPAQVEVAVVDESSASSVSIQKRQTLGQETTLVAMLQPQGPCRPVLGFGGERPWLKPVYGCRPV